MPRSHRGFNTLKVLDSKGGPLKRERFRAGKKALRQRQRAGGRVAIERGGGRNFLEFGA